MAVSSAAQRFVQAPVYSEGTSPALQVASGDFNGDGNTDLAFVSNTTPPMVTIRLGTGTGKFDQGQEITLSDSAAGIVAGDWNNDGVIDLAVSTYTLQGITNLSTLLGHGDGTFTAAGSFDASGNAGLMASADLNGDGLTDIVVASISDSDAVAVLMLGLGGGKFAKGTSLNVIGNAPDHPVSVVIADFNRDGILDLAVNGVCTFDGRSTLAIVLGKGNATFGVPRDYTTATNDYNNLIASDFNGDGLLDLMNSGNELAVHIGRGDGTFAPPLMIAGVSDYGGFIAAGDWNKDGKARHLTGAAVCRELCWPAVGQRRWNL
ncbi:MAG: VCBS repeat-containing protein [Acidobacteriales bacterium]|nr:VCBS repeat-containing protein [Terriglobales bacterium]